MKQLHKHMNPATLKECGEAIAAVIEAVPALRYAADTLKANSYPLNAMVDVEAAGQVLTAASAILKRAREEARAERSK